VKKIVCDFCEKEFEEPVCWGGYTGVYEITYQIKTMSNEPKERDACPACLKRLVNGEEIT
jgi:hypothetical protein